MYGGNKTMVKTDAEMLEKYKERIKRQNNKIKEDYDRVSATLPKGTIERIKALGLTINGVINDSVLAFLECAEEEQESETEPPPEPRQEQLFADVQGFKVPAHIGENGQIQVYAEDLPRLQLKPGKKKNFNIA